MLSMHLRLAAVLQLLMVRKSIPLQLSQTAQQRLPPSQLRMQLQVTLQMVLQELMLPVGTSTARAIHRIASQQKAQLERAGSGGRQLHPACEWKCRQRRLWTERSVPPLQRQRPVEWLLVLQPQVVLELELML